MPGARREEAFPRETLANFGEQSRFGAPPGETRGGIFLVRVERPACPLLPGAFTERLQSSPPPPALPLLTPLYVKLYHEDGISLLLS